MLDAVKPVVEEMIAQIDREFPSVRKELMMSIVNEEADNIVQDAADAGALEPEIPEDTTDPADAEAALAAAEAELAEVIGGEIDAINSAAQGDTSSPESSEVTDPASEVTSETAEPPLAEEPTASKAPDEQGHDAPPTVDQTPSSKVDEETQGEAVDSEVKTVASPDVAAAAEDSGPHACTNSPQPMTEPKPEADKPPPAQPSPKQSAPQGAPVAAAVEADPTAFDAAYTPERAQQAVEEIERGIQKLAHILRTEVDEQWKQARSACVQVASAQRELEGAHGTARQMLEDIAHLREEAELAREGADLARREAQLFRDGADRLRKRGGECLPGAAI